MLQPLFVLLASATLATLVARSTAASSSTTTASHHVVDSLASVEALLDLEDEVVTEDELTDELQWTWENLPHHRLELGKRDQVCFIGVQL